MSPIDDKYNSFADLLGSPVDIQGLCPDGVGLYHHFEGGSIHWHPEAGVHETHGSIRSAWADLGWEQGFLGYPVSDEHEISEWRLDDLTNCGNAAKRDSGISTEEPKSIVPRPSPDLFPINQLGIDPSYARISLFQHGAIAYVPSTGSLPVFKRLNRERYRPHFEFYKVQNATFMGSLLNAYRRHF